MIEKELLIVGAGPAGLTLASALLPSVPATVISEHSRPQSFHSRATGIQPRTLDILSSVGIIDAVRREALTLLGNRVYVDGVERLAVSFYDPQTRQHGLSLDQRRIEKLLEDRSAKLGRDVAWGTSLVDLHEGNGRVMAEVQRDDGSTELWGCRFVVGCDGGRSAVRKAAGIPFSGTTYTERNFVLDGLVHGDLEPGFMHYFVGKETRLVLVPLNDRGLFKVSGAFAPNAEGDELALLAALAREHGRGAIDIEPLTPCTTYVMHARIADAFQRNGRIFLCGDAAHLFPPNGGQGMNVALEDAFELARVFNRLAEGAESSDLARYEGRRGEVAKRLQAVIDTKDLYSYERLQAPLDPSQEQRRIEREEL
jgi:2-polyprenyl-6-methoxyphenol hydroxylase-like FAD-dependent oxidoreductase